MDRLSIMTDPTPTEAGALIAVLERNRHTFAGKTEGLDEKGLRATTAASTREAVDGRVGEDAPAGFTI
jgi:hypothetical protein